MYLLCDGDGFSIYNFTNIISNSFFLDYFPWHPQLLPGISLRSHATSLKLRTETYQEIRNFATMTIHSNSSIHIAKLHLSFCFILVLKTRKNIIRQHACIYYVLTTWRSKAMSFVDTSLELEFNFAIFAIVKKIAKLRPDSTGAFSRRNANYFACFFWIATTRINYFYLIAHNSKETGEIFRISPRKSARGIRA
jgi:hypothetical protein